MRHALLCLVMLLVPARVLAGGLYLTDRGSRALGRGGAFAAGSDDGQSLWYNPAGLAFTGRKQLHLDATLTLFHGSFARTTRDDVNPPAPEVEADPALLPIPTLAYSDDFGLKDWAFGVALMAPNAVMLSWPETVGGVPGPTRYSLISMEGSVIANLALGFAYRGIDGLSIGAGVHVIAARFRAGVYLNACDYGLLCTHPEDPDYESPAIIDLPHALTATPTFGVIYAREKFRVGASLMLFYKVQGDASLDVRLPNAPLFGEAATCGNNEQRAQNPDCARVTGEKANLSLDFPMVARIGFEFRPSAALRLELDAVYEGWSRQKEMRIEPQNIAIENALGIPLYEVGDIGLPRQMRDVYSLRFGGEYDLFAKLTVRAGLLLENSAFRSRTLTPMTLDSDKALVSLGASARLREGLWLDLFYAHLFMRNVRVDDSIVYPQNPLRPAPSAPGPNDPQPDLGRAEPVGNGRYGMEADLLGLGLRWNVGKG